MNFAKIIIPFIFLIYGVLKYKGVELNRITLSSNECFGFSFFLLVLGIVAGYYEQTYDKENINIKDKLKIFYTEFCFFLFFLGLGYFIIYLFEIYNNDFYFILSLGAFSFCGINMWKYHTTRNKKQ